MPTVKYKDIETVTHSLVTNDGDVVGTEVPVHDIRTLPAAFTTAIDDINASLTAIKGYVDGLEGYTDGLEGKLDTLHTDLATTLAGLLTDLKGYTDQLEGYVDGLETLITSSNTKLDTIHTDLATTLAGYVDQLEGYTDQLEGYVDGLETLIASTNTKLDTLNTSVVAAGAGAVATTYQEQKTGIGTGSTVNFTSQALTRGMWVQNVSTAGQVLYLAISGTPSSSNGTYLYPGEKIWVDLNNANVPGMRASAASAIANMWGW